MRFHSLPMLSVCVLLLTTVLHAESDQNREAIPTGTAIKEAMSLIKDVYKNDFSSAKKPAEKIALAKKLIQTSNEEKDANGRYALLALARDLAADSGDIDIAVQAIDQMAQGFQVDALAAKADAAVTTAKNVATPEDRRRFFAVADSLVNDALSTDRYDVAKQLAELNVAVCKAVADSTLSAQANATVQRAKNAETGFLAVKKPLSVLAEKPNDPEANCAVGKYRCFVKGDWDKGLLMLAIGSDAALKSLAEKEIAGPQTAEDQMKLADGWWDVAEREGAVAKQQIQQHAVRWYQESLPHLTGLAKAKTEKRLQEAHSQATGRPADTLRPGKGFFGTARKEANSLSEVISEPLTVGGPDILVRVKKTVTVTEKGSLVIQPGTLLEFAPATALKISGTLTAEGTQERPILLTGSDKKAGWTGLQISGAGGSSLKWCIVTLGEAGIKLQVEKQVSVEHCAIVQNKVGLLIVNAGLEISDSLISYSVEDGVVGGQDQQGKWNNVTISNSGAIGYHGTFKGWPIMRMCVITNNRKGGIQCERGGGTYRGKPDISDSSIFDNGVFDICCSQPENYEFSNIFVGSESSKILAKDPSARVRNILDSRTTAKKDNGVVTIKDAPTEPVAKAGASQAVLEMAKPFVPAR